MGEGRKQVGGRRDEVRRVRWEVGGRGREDEAGRRDEGGGKR